MSRITKTAAIAAATITLALNGAQAQTAGVAPPDEITIVATRVPIPRDRVGSSVSVVTRAEIERGQQTQAIDVLRRLPGVAFTRSGGFGSTALLRLRGSEPGMVKVLVDGVELNDASGAGRDFDFGGLTTADIERIEVLRGPQGALYGNDAMAGVISITTRRPGGPAAATATLEAGPLGTRRGALSLTGAAGPVDYAATAESLETDGFSRVAAGGENDGAAGRSLRGRIGVGPADRRLELSGGWSRLRSDFDPSASRDGPASVTKETVQGRGAFQVAGPDGRFTGTAAVGAARTERRFDEPLGFYRVSSFDSDQIGADLTGDLRLRAADVATLGLALDRETARTTTTRPGAAAPVAGLDDGVDTWAAFGQYVGAITDRLTVTAGVRHDDHAGFGGATTSRATAALRAGDAGTVLRASYGTARRAPSLFQLYDPTYGNARLRPEKSWGADAGVEQPLPGGWATASVTLFRNRFRDLIAFTGGYENVGRARTSGLEATLTATPIDGLDLTASWTWLDAENLDTGRELPRRPRNAASLAVDWAVLPDLGLGLDLVHASSQLDRATATSPRLAGHTVVTSTARWTVAEGVSLYGRIENLFDAHYQEVLGYRTSGRAAYAGVRAAF